MQGRPILQNCWRMWPTLLNFAWFCEILDHPQQIWSNFVKNETNLDDFLRDKFWDYFLKIYQIISLIAIFSNFLSLIRSEHPQSAPTWSFSTNSGTFKPSPAASVRSDRFKGACPRCQDIPQRAGGTGRARGSVLECDSFRAELCWQSDPRVQGMYRRRVPDQTPRGKPGGEGEEPFLDQFSARVNCKWQNKLKSGGKNLRKSYKNGIKRTSKVSWAFIFVRKNCHRRFFCPKIWLWCFFSSEILSPKANFSLNFASAGHFLYKNLYIKMLKNFFLVLSFNIFKTWKFLPKQNT